MISAYCFSLDTSRPFVSFVKLPMSFKRPIPTLPLGRGPDLLYKFVFFRFSFGKEVGPVKSSEVLKTPG